MKNSFREQENKIILIGIILAIAVAAACFIGFFLLNSYIAEAAEKSRERDYTLSKEMQDELAGNNTPVPTVTPEDLPETAAATPKATSAPVKTVMPETQHNMTLTPTPDPQEYWATHPTPTPVPTATPEPYMPATAWLNTPDKIDMTQYRIIPAASSSATSDNVNSDAAYAFDGTTLTVWCEGEEGDGTEEILYVKLNSDEKISFLTFKLGNWTSYDTWAGNGRPSEMTVWLAGTSYRVRFPDYMEEYVLQFSRKITASELSFRIEGVSSGGSEDTYITDIQIYGEAG